MITKLNSHRTLIVLFILSVPILYLLQYLSLSPVLNYGFTPDDWGLLFFYKSLGPDPLSKIPYVWAIKGAYTTGPIYFIGILNHFFGLNYQAYQITNIILKILATLSLYPLILIVFKRRSLAFLTTFIYGISDMASRSLEYVVKGTDYLAIIPMNMFFIIYYCIVTSRVKGLWPFILMSFFWFSSLMISPIRIYPVLVLVPLIEIFFWIQTRSVKTVANSLKRLLLLYSPFLLVYLYKPSSILSFLQSPHLMYQGLLNGNWHLALTPFQGVGLSLIFLEQWNKVFGSINLESMNDYLLFLLGSPLFIFGILTIFLSIIKFKKRLRFFILTLSISLILFIGFFFLAVHIPNKDELHFDPNTMYPILISGFMLAVSLSAFLEWRDLGKKDTLLLSLWISTPIILLYTFLIWILAPFGVGFEGQQGYYLVVPTIATSLFLSSFLVIILDKALSLGNRFFKLILVWIFCGILILLFLTNRFNIYHYYNSAGVNGRLALDQERMYNQVLDHLENFKYNEPALFYFDVYEDIEWRSYYYEEVLFHDLPIRMFLGATELNDGCIGTFYRGIDNLAKLVAVKNGLKGFISQGFCVTNGNGGNAEGIFYKFDNFYAFKAKNGELTDITPEVLEKLGFK